MRTALAAAVLALLTPTPAHAAAVHRSRFTAADCAHFLRVPSRDHRTCVRPPPPPPFTTSSVVGVDDRGTRP